MSDYNKIISTINSVSSNYSYSPDPNNLICIDSSNNRIGINTLNPTESIDISGGNIRANDFIFMEPTNDSVSLRELLNSKAPINNPSFTGIISNIDVSGTISASNIDVSGTIKTYKYDEIYKPLGQTIINTTTNQQVGSYITTNYEGNIIAIGSNAGYHSGIIRIYKYNDISWVQISQNMSPGYSISLNSSGTIIAIGNHKNISPSLFYTGHVRVYKYVNDNSWVKISQDILGLVNGDQFGYSTSINSAGTIVAIGSLYANTTNGSDSGSVSVYRYITDGSWVPLGQTINGEGPNGLTGWSVALDTSGSILAIGSSNINNATGRVRVYRYTNDTSWVLISQAIDGTSQYDSFGNSISLNGDGTLVACGAIAPTSTGHVKVYKYISDGSWIPQGQTISGEALNDYSGYSVSLNKQGNILAIGSPNNDGTANNAGRVKIYKYNDVSWIQIGTDIDGDMESDFLGKDIALNGLGNRLVVGVVGRGLARVYQTTDVIQTATSNIVPLANNTYTLGSSSLYWSNAYIRDVSASNIDVSGNLNPLLPHPNSSSLGSSSKRWTNAWITNINGSIYNGTSDDRVKHNEVVIANGLDVIDKLCPKFYQKTIDMLDANYYGDLSGHTWNYESGLIAQELLQISDLSFVVSGGDYYDSNNNLIKQTYGVNYNSVFVYGLAAIKELHAKVKAQETTILSLQTTILSLQTAMLEQQALINNIILAQGQNNS